jgi:hypothetical protein
MRKASVILAFIGILLFASLGFAHKVYVDYDRSVDFSKFRTFRWVEKPETDNSLMDDRVVNAVNGQLRLRGLELVSGAADLNVSAKTSIQERQIVHTYYDWGPGWGWGPGWRWGWGWNGPGWATNYVDTYLESTTIVNLIDAASEKTIWQGIATGSISHKPYKAASKTVERIADMFEKYPWVSARISE